MLFAPMQSESFAENPTVKVMLVAGDPDRARLMQDSLRSAGCEVCGSLTPADDLPATARRLHSDVLVVHVKSPEQKTLDDMHAINERMPMPMVMFTEDDASEVIRTAVKAGVSAYIVDGFQSHRVRPILDVAIARFQQTQCLRGELDKARSSLAERKVIERAKGILMDNKGMSEDQAYRTLRSQAMTQNARLVEVARNLVSAAQLLA